MRVLLRILTVVVVLGGSVFAASRPDQTCPAEMQDAAGSCVSKPELREAEQAFAHALKLQKDKHPDEAFPEFEHAAALLPRNVEYVTAREVARQQLVFAHIEAGNQAMLVGESTRAMAEFRAAVELDPENQFAMQRLKDALGDKQPKVSPALRLVAQADEIEAQPQPGRRNIHVRGDSRGLLTEIARQFGLQVVFDDTVQTKQVRFELDNVDFPTAMQVASQMTHTFWTPISETQVFFADDSVQNRRQFERMSLRTFYVPEADTPQEMNQLATLLRSLFDIRLITTSASQSLITMRGPRRLLDAATHFMEALSTGRPQVALDVEVFEVNRTSLLNLGIQMPQQITVFNIPTVAAQLASQPGVQDLINQLIASGGINQANSVAIAALLAQLQGQQSPLFQPFATFGGGKTLSGLALGSLTVNANFDDSRFQSLEHMTLRASQGNAATFFVGERFPILNAIFSPILNSAALTGVIQNGSFTAPFPSFTYEDIGMTVKATPQIHRDSAVTLKLDLAIKNLTGQQFNGIPVLGNREYQGAITLKDGEPAVVAGEIVQSTQHQRTGVPGLGQIPLLGRAFSNETTNKSSSEILVVITPHILELPQDKSAESEVWLGAGNTQ